VEGYYTITRHTVNEPDIGADVNQNQRTTDTVTRQVYLFRKKSGQCEVVLDRTESY
jgi:hypothetical protein